MSAIAARRQAIAARAAALAAQVQARLDAAARGRYVPIDRYLAWLRDPSTAGNYAEFPGSLGPALDDFAAESGAEALRDLHRLALVQLVAESVGRLEDAGVALSVRPVLLRWVEDVLQRVEAGDGAWLVATGDFFRKDLHVAALRLLPTNGCCHIEQAGLSRAFLAGDGAGQALRGLRTLLLDLRGDHRHLYSLHLDDRLVTPHFLADGWMRTYRDVAEQLKLHPEIQALHADAWFFDPQVAEVSPKLAYVRAIPEEGGARFFRLGHGESARKDALTDRKRRRLHEEGKYDPCMYLMVWPRRDLIRYVASKVG